jgi:hypothetical protein
LHRPHHHRSHCPGSGDAANLTWEGTHPILLPHVPGRFAPAAGIVFEAPTAIKEKFFDAVGALIRRKVTSHGLIKEIIRRYGTFREIHYDLYLQSPRDTTSRNPTTYRRTGSTNAPCEGRI